MRPVSAAAAAIAGETRCVRLPLPWRPTKLRLEVEAQRLPAGTMSPFIATHIEQPDSRHSKPASRKMRSRPSFSAASFTVVEPGETIAGTLALPRFATAAAARRSSIRALVHEPMNTWSTAMSVSAIPGTSPMYFSARSMDAFLSGSGSAAGSGTRPVTGKASSGLLPQVTIGASWFASRETSASKTASGSEGSVLQ